MNPVIISNEDLKLYFSDKYHHSSYDETVNDARDLRVHADGVFPTDLIETRRPHESQEVLEYRQSIYKPITKGYMGKIFTSLNKIRRSTEWSIKYDDGAVPARIPEGETLEDYLERNFPHFTSLTNWTFGFLLREYGIESNGWIVMTPENPEASGSEYIRPFPRLYRAEQIVEIRDEYVVIKSDDKIIYKEDDVQKFGDCYYIITTYSIQRWEQTKSDRTFALKSDYIHELGILPAFKMKGKVKKNTDSTFINESRIADILPHFDEALREYSDLQADVVQNIFNEKWEYVQDDCESCKGSGFITMKGAGFKGRDDRHSCTVCGGNGKQKRGPFTTLMIKAPEAGDAQNMPTPPAGYIAKDTNIITIQDARIDRHISSGLSAINMEFLMQSPLDQSGVSKAYDADETNNFVHSVAEDIVAIMDQVAYFTNEMRYRIVVPNDSDRLAMLPTIAVPERFDLFSAQMVEQELLNAKAKNINPVIVNAIELEYANRKFSTDPDVRDQLALTLQLDPLANIDEASKVMMLQNGGITKGTYVISCNIYGFVNRAIDEKGDDFFDMELKEQKALMADYAKEQIDAASPEKQIATDLGLGG